VTRHGIDNVVHHGQREGRALAGKERTLTAVSVIDVFEVFSPMKDFAVDWRFAYLQPRNERSDQ